MRDQSLNHTTGLPRPHRQLQSSRTSKDKLKNDTARRRPAEDDAQEAAINRPPPSNKRQPCFRAPRTTPSAWGTTTAHRRRPHGELGLSPLESKGSSGRGPRQGLQEGSDAKLVPSMPWPPPMTKGFPRSRSTSRPQGNKTDQKGAGHQRGMVVFNRTGAGRRAPRPPQYTSTITSPPARPKSRTSTYDRRSP